VEVVAISLSSLYIRLYLPIEATRIALKAVHGSR
jgi:hypothetical protein